MSSTTASRPATAMWYNIELEYSNTIVKLMRFENYDFWNKVKTKFL
ncbi:MAG: hypothetical protein ACOX4I_09435 [Anaerovoracaceae bacterium]